MIKKLESAGLGFYVKSTETQDRLGKVTSLMYMYIIDCKIVFGSVIKGKIPLRQLVYRVLDLPPSMRPLVYDFGQLNKKNETDYVGQIVKNHVSDLMYIHVVHFVTFCLLQFAVVQAPTGTYSTC